MLTSCQAGGVGPRVVGVVVADDVAAARHVEQDGLVHVADDVVLDQVVGGAAAQDDAVAVARRSRSWPSGGSRLSRTTHAVGAGQRDVHAADGAVGLHVLDPAVGGVRDVDAARHLAVVAGVGAALDGQALDARPAHDRVLRSSRDLREIRARRTGRSSAAASSSVSVPRGRVDGGDLDALADRAFVDALEVLAVALLHGRVVHLVDQRQIARGEFAGVRADGDRRGFLERVGGQRVGGVVVAAVAALVLARADRQRRSRRRS